MKDKLIDFIEEHRRDSILLGIILIVVIFVIISTIISSIKEKKQTIPIETNTETVVTKPIEEDTINDEPIKSEYQNSLGLDSNKNDDGRVELEELPEKRPEYETEVLTAPKYNIKTKIFDHTSVPTKNMDGTRLSEFVKGVKNSSFSHNFGYKLDELDFIGGKIYYVGVEQDLDDTDKGVNLESLGWLINNIETLQPNDIIKFTNLHVVSNIAEDKIGMVCSYDWYSAYGMKDTLVYFEDISGTLNVTDFNEGDIFSTFAFVHNIKVEQVNKYRVVNVQYYLFPEDMTVTNPTSYLSKSDINYLGPTNFYAEDNTANFEIYWYYNEDGTVETHVLYPNGKYNDETVSEELIKNINGTYDIQLVYDNDKTVRTTLYKE